MSELSYLEKLLDGVEVEWRTLGEIAVIYDGTHKTPKYTASGVPFVSVQNIKNLYGTNKYISPEDFKTYKNKPRKHDLFMTRIGDVGTCAIVEDDRPLAYYVTLALIRINQQIAVPGFIRYLIESRFGKAELYKRTLIHAVPMKINLGEIGKVAVPIPCPDNPEKSLAIQSEIVRILDKFTALTAELTAELTARKKQYNYYRDQLLSFEEGDVAWKTLGEISRKISSGGTPKTGVTEYYDGTIPWLRTQEVDFREIWDTEIKITEEGLKTSSAKWIPKDCIIIAMYGATVGKIGINKIPMTTNQACANIQLDEEIVHYRYVFHFLCSQYAYIKSLGTGSQTNINAQIVKNIKIPVPFAENPEKSLNEQLRIVNILDKFDTLTNSITEGLPREIELRQKQYEYYRDLLFSFPKPETVSN